MVSGKTRLWPVGRIWCPLNALKIKYIYVEYKFIKFRKVLKHRKIRKKQNIIKIFNITKIKKI